MAGTVEKLKTIESRRVKLCTSNRPIEVRVGGSNRLRHVQQPISGGALQAA